MNDPSASHRRPSARALVYLILVALSTAGFILCREEARWDRWPLIVVLTILAFGLEYFSTRYHRPGSLNFSSSGMVFAVLVVLAGAPPSIVVAAAIGAVGTALSQTSSRWDLIFNVTTYSFYIAAAGVLAAVILPAESSVLFVPAALVIYLAAHLANWITASVAMAWEDGVSFPDSVQLLMMHLPGTLASGLVFAATVYSYTEVGLLALALLSGGTLLFEILIGQLSVVRFDLKSSREREQLYLDVAGAIIVAVGSSGQVERVNRKASQLLGVDAKDALGQPWNRVLQSANPPTGSASLEELLTGRQDAERQLEVLMSAGNRERLIRWTATPVRDDGTHLGVVLSGDDVTDRRAAEQQIAHLAYHDPLTGLPNRSRLESHLAVAVENAREHGHVAAVLFCDLDGFKSVNDLHGHGAGDDLLRAVAARLGAAVRPADLLVRQGGDEFIVLVPDLHLPPRASLAEAKVAVDLVVDRLQAAIRDPFAIAGLPYRMGVSIGTALYPHEGSTADELQRIADGAMYRDKRARAIAQRGSSSELTAVA